MQILHTIWVSVDDWLSLSEPIAAVTNSCRYTLCSSIELKFLDRLLSFQNWTTVMHSNNHCGCPPCMCCETFADDVECTARQFIGHFKQKTEATVKDSATNIIYPVSNCVFQVLWSLVVLRWNPTPDPIWFQCRVGNATYLEEHWSVRTMCWLMQRLTNSKCVGVYLTSLVGSSNILQCCIIRHSFYANCSFLLLKNFLI